MLITIDYINSAPWKKYFSRNFYTRNYSYNVFYDKSNTKISHGFVQAVMSYDTLIGYADMNEHIFFTWGYGAYSATTSKQITQYCHENGLMRVDIEKCSLEKIVEKIMEGKMP